MANVSTEQENKPTVAVLLLRGIKDDLLLDIERIISENEEDGDEVKMNTIHQFTSAEDNQQGQRESPSPSRQHGDQHESRIEFLGWSMPYPKDLWIPDYPDSERYWNYIRYAEAVDRLNKALAPGKPCRTCVEKLQRIYGQEPRLGRMPSSDEEAMCTHAFSTRPEDNCSRTCYYQGEGPIWQEPCSSGENPIMACHVLCENMMTHPQSTTFTPIICYFRFNTIAYLL